MSEDERCRSEHSQLSAWAALWPTAYVRPRGPWTVRGASRWGILDPERGNAEEVDPAADVRLPGLAAALRTGRLHGYRAGRRAVVATPTGFVKVVRPERVEALVQRHALLGGLAVPFSVPTVRNVSGDGRIELSTMAGESLHCGLRTNPTRTLDDIAEVVAALHSQPVPEWLPVRAPDDPGVWVATSRRSPTPYLESIERASRGLPLLEPRAGTLVHGDLHDKNVFSNVERVEGQLRSGLIDLDGLGTGAPEDDVANLAVHLELRNLQGRSGRSSGARSSDLYERYERRRPLDHERLRAVERQTWFRLACIYQYRAPTRRLVPQFLRAAAGD